MLIKEYRIPLPFTVEEYRVAHLYMVAKKSREESRGADSGVEILINEPYNDGLNNEGQFTHKVYHIGSHLPGWFKKLMPKSALVVEEKAWNSYPYTKTIYTWPFMERFALEIETKYVDDGRQHENVFQLSDLELGERTVDTIDIVNDSLDGEYRPDEDPKLFVSEKTGRGPLEQNWIGEYWEACRDQTMPLADGRAIMCAYKLCRVEFKCWGMQSRIEKFIHDFVLRKTMLHGHRQVWVWQDEWVGLSMDDIRCLEKETQTLLAEKMASDTGSKKEIKDDTVPTISFPSLSIHCGESLISDTTPILLTTSLEDSEKDSSSVLSPEVIATCLTPDHLTNDAEGTSGDDSQFNVNSSINLQATSTASLNRDYLDTEYIIIPSNKTDSNGECTSELNVTFPDAIGKAITGKWSSTDTVPDENPLLIPTTGFPAPKSGKNKKNSSQHRTSRASELRSPHSDEDDKETKLKSANCQQGVM